MSYGLIDELKQLARQKVTAMPCFIEYSGERVRREPFDLCFIRAFLGCGFLLLLLAGCSGSDEPLKTESFEPIRAEPLWYQAANRRLSNDQTAYGYGYGKTLEIARLDALKEIQQDVVPPRLISSVQFKRERDVQEYDDFVQGRTTENLVRNISTYYRALTISGSRHVSGSREQLEGYYYVGLSYDKRALHIKLEERLAGACAAEEASQLGALRHDVRIAEDLRRMGCPVRYRLDYDKGLWRLDVHGERLDVTDQDLHKYFFPAPYDASEFQALSPSGQTRSSALLEGDQYRIRYQPSDTPLPYLYWLYVDALGRVYSLQQQVSKEGRGFVLPGFNGPPFEAVLNQDGEEQAVENFLLLKCSQQVRQLRVPPISEAVPDINSIHYFKLGLILSDITDGCEWESLSVTISRKQG